MVWTGQNAVRWHAWKHPLNTTLFLSGKGPNYYEIRCVDCEDLCETGFVWVPKKRVGFATRRRKVWKPWNADHEVEIQDGGEHTLDNLRPRCTCCHDAKTRREHKRRIVAKEMELA
jgi:5-methylcytosine-specific restriction endonuclease McrA